MLRNGNSNEHPTVCINVMCKLIQQNLVLLGALVVLNATVGVHTTAWLLIKMHNYRVLRASVWSPLFSETTT